MPVVAIGASAGGLEACRALLKDMPGDMPAAFILILHLDPTHDSLMVDLLADNTQLKVVQAADGMALQRGYVHVIPPGVFLTVTQNVIHLSEPDGGKVVRMPFDVLLRSLARDAGAFSGCVVLSGTGTDGSAGIEDIHAAGGLVIAQDPLEAGYKGMPESAVATGFVSQVMPCSQMVAAIDNFVRNLIEGCASTHGTLTRSREPAQGADAKSRCSFDDILSCIGAHTDQDLSLYKRGTLERRIARRMAAIGLDAKDMSRYLAVLRNDAEERDNLVSDLLIHVTSFFRDPAVFDELSAKAIPELIKAMSADRPLRVWAAGCSTGEEAYSLAMLCIEAMEAAGSGVRLQILASDIDPDAIASARTGFYAKNIEAVVSPERLARFFVAEDGGWRVISELRDVIVFTVADILSDPPFSKIDLVSCRNLLIYLGAEAQKRVIARCCFALRPGGLLLLGTAEMPGKNDGCFALENKTARLWRRVGHSQARDLHFAVTKRDAATPSPTDQTNVRRTALAELSRRIVLENYAPASALLNGQLEVLYLLGPTDKYLRATEGHPDRGILGMLPRAMRVRFREAAASCTPSNPVVPVSGRSISGPVHFDIILHAVPGESEPMILACFLESAHLDQEDDPVSSTTGSSRHSRKLETDLEATRRDLNDALRDLELEVEAHSADAAEALSINEEFQSTNEELLASKEELQSLNEELTALNSQLQETLERHRTTANDLQNVLYSTDVATLFLDMDMNIRFFTPAARAIFNVIPTDIGRPLTDLASVSSDDKLVTDAEDVLDSSKPIEREITGANETWFLRRVQPYRAEGERVEGVVVTYLDITERKRTHAALKAATENADRATQAKSRFLATASHDLRQPLQSMALLHKLLSKHKRSTEGARLIKLLDQTLGSMTAMLDSMLDVNRIESGMIRSDMRPVAIASLMRRLKEEFDPLCNLKGLKLRLVPCKAWVRTDPQLLEQILRNLLSNALKYTSKGGILMGCRRRGTKLDVLVIDSGIGVPESETKTIFNAYYQGDKAYTLTGHGLGLGLSIVQRLAKLMDHPVSLRSVPGRGSAFMITLPIVEAQLAVLQPPKALSAMTRSPRQTGTILLVEDEDDLRDLLAETLIAEGHKVISKADAKEALQWAGSDVARPDLLLTDFDLDGGTSGLRLAEDLPDVLGEAVPSIILTGDITTATLKSIAGSAHRQVTKPVMPEVLLAQISDLMQNSRSTRLTSSSPADPTVTTVHVIDDDPVIRETMRRLFEAEGWTVATYASAEDFLALPRPAGSACLLVDSVLPGMNGVALIAQLRSQKSFLPAVMLTGHGDAAMAVAAMKAGASDLIEKPASASDLLASVRQAMKAGRDGVPPDATRIAAEAHFQSLTKREREVLLKVLNGIPNKIIADDLGINQRTVENHRASVMRKTGAASLPALVRLALVARVHNT